jgi:carboxylesterase
MSAAGEARVVDRAWLDGNPFTLGPVGGSGPAVLCLHGLTGTPAEVRAPAELLAHDGFACVGPLLPGHGTTPEELAATPWQAWTECAERTFDILAETHRRVYVLGLSAGGVVGLWLAARRPIAGALILAAPLRLTPLYNALVRSLHRMLRSVPREPKVYDSDVRARLPGYRRMPLPAVAQLLQLQLRVERNLPNVTAPLRLLYSVHDPTVPFWNAALIKRLAARAHTTVETVHRSLHIITVDVERMHVASWVVERLRELEAGSEAAQDPGINGK